MNILKRMSIKKNIMALYIATTLITFGVVYYVLFSNWIETADKTLSSVAQDMNNTIYKEFEGFIRLPRHLNEMTENQIRSGVLDFSDETTRDKFFVGLLSAHGSTPIYSISIGTEKGEYYGARRNTDNTVEIMKNNSETGGRSMYYKVSEDMTKGDLALQTGTFDPRTRPWYREAIKNGKTTFSPLYKHFVMDDLTISVGTPVHDRDGKIWGVLGTHITLSRMDSFLNDIVKKNNAAAVIIDKNTGELVANSLGVRNFTVNEDGTIKRTLIGELKNRSIMTAYGNYLNSQDSDILTVNGQNSHVNVSGFDATGVEMLLITSVPDALLTKDIYETIRLTVIFSLLMLSVTALFYLSHVANMLKPLESLNLSAEKFKEGDFSSRAHIHREDEIGTLARTFNMLADDVSGLVRDLEKKVRERTSDLEMTNIALDDKRGQLKLILDSTAEGIFGMDTEGICTFCNESALRMLGYDSQEDLLGKNMHGLIHHTKKDGNTFPEKECRIMQSFKKGKGVYVDDEVYWRKDGTSFDVRYSSFPQHRDGVLVGAVVTFMDNTERKKSEENIRYLTYHDPLTDIHNRLFFEKEVPLSDTEENLPISVIFGDVNGLKLTNDIFGHTAGDRLLIEAAAAFKKASSEKGILARIGGDEFALVLPLCDEARANEIMAEIKSAFGLSSSGDIIGSLSLGASTKTEPGQSMAETIESAENRMYREKTINRTKNNTNMIRKIMGRLHERSPREKIHSENVYALCKRIAREMGLSEAEVNRVAENGYYHDIGKIVLDDSVLTKHRNFNEEEYRKMQQHSVVGYRILNLFDETLDLSDGALSHHEHWDGSGYPKGTAGEGIPLSGRIIAVAEAYDAMTNDYYERSKTHEEAVAEIESLAGSRFDRRVVSAFTKAAGKNIREMGSDK